MDLEALEQRRLLSGGPNWHPTNTNVLDGVNGPIANLGTDAVKIYGEYLNYEANGAKGAFTSSFAKKINFVNTYIGVDVRGYGDFTTYQGALKSLGMVVTATVPKYDLIEGYFPLAKLPQLASEAQTIGGEPMYIPVNYQQGVSPNQSDLAINGPAAKAAFKVDGTGQKIGVLSDSVSNLNNGNGLAQSVASGDLPAGVQIIQDLPGTTVGGVTTYTGTDEGRAMLEQIYDIAPGAQFAYATAFLGEASFATNIQALYNVGARTIVDDVGYFLDPYYQDGIIQQAVNNIVASGGTYLASAGNQADSGYESQFRSVTTTVGSLGSGTYMNFDPSGSTTSAQLGINVYTPDTGIVLQFDQPFYTTSGVTSNVEIDILNAAGTVVAQGNANNVAMQQPTQITGRLPAGLYTVAIKVDSGPAPGHVVFYATGDGGFSVDTKYGAAGGTYYPSTTGHNSGAQTISVGAVPFWGTPNYVHTPAAGNPANTNEPFSSTGPVLKVFAPDGTPLAAPSLLLKPDLSSADGNNTSFFGQNVNTTQVVFPAYPPYPGDPATTFSEPTTPTNQSVPTLPNFFGTSSAAPNLAAVVALMKQANPTLTRDQILGNLVATATPLNGQAKGNWSPQAGYGLANALAALSYVATLKVVSIVPGGNSLVPNVPAYLDVTFNQAVQIGTLSAANLLVAGPNGATVVVGTPVGVDNPFLPSVVRFPITIVPNGLASANGIYKDALVGAGITSAKGQPLSATYFDQFNLEQLQGPKVIGTNFFGRIVTIAFSEGLNPATANGQNIFLFRNGGVFNPNLGPAAVVVSQLPGATFSYNPINFTVTLDLTNVSQSSLPTDHYGLVVRSFVYDGVNNPLNGTFNGVFPSGTNPAAPGGSTFFQDLGVVAIKAPIISALTLAPASDSGVQGDSNTNITSPSLIGQVAALFPGTVSNLLVYAEFNGIPHQGVAPGGLDLNVDTNGRGLNGHFDVQTTTDAFGRFTIKYPAGFAPLPEGTNRVRVVVIGAADQPPFPGLATAHDTSFRVDTSNPYIGQPTSGGPATSILPGQNINSLTNLTLNIVDPVNPQAIGSPFAVDPRLAIPALDPVVADNVQNYRLFRVVGAGLVDESSFITSATFVSTSARVQSSDPYTGQVNLTFAPGLPTGNYRFLALSSAYGQGLTDAAGNPLNGMGPGGLLNYELDFSLQPTPTYITSYVAYTPDAATPGGLDTSGVRANYELPISGIAPRSAAPPTLFTIDFSNTLNPLVNYTNAIQLVRSANAATSLPDGNFGDLGMTNTSGFTTVAGIKVTLTNSVPGAVYGQYGFDNRLLIQLPDGFTLPADYYRLYLPNSATSPITDIFGNVLDGEFDGYQNATGKYVDQLQNGTVRGAGNFELPDLSGDGNAGGAFMTGFVVVPNGNIIYAQADAIYNPQIPSQTPDGSLARPYPVLAPEAIPNAINGGDLNSAVNAGTNFNATYDRSGDGQFEPSAFFAAQQKLQATGGPVVVIAEASVPSRDLTTGAIVQKPFILEAPAPSGGQIATIANDATTAIPALTTVVLASGSTLKLQNAALLVQNQGSALQILGGANPDQRVVVTSYKDSSIGGVSNGDSKSVPLPGDYGGIVYRNFSQAALPGQSSPRADLFPGQIPITGNVLTDNRLKGQFTTLGDPKSQADAVSGADDVMSTVQFLTEKYAGGAVPQTVGIRYDGITLLNSRPSIVDSTISQAGGAGSAQAGLSADVDSLRSDDVAQGPLIRNDLFLNNGLNGIYIRANVANGVAQPTDAEAYPTNPTTSGGSANYVFNSPYPYLLTSKMQIGQRLMLESGALTDTTDRLYVIPGMLVKFERGAWLEIGQEVQGGRFGRANSTGQGTAAGLVVGDPTYMNEYDKNNLVSPASPGFKANSSQLAKVLFTSFNDNAATTSFIDPNTQFVTTIVAALPALPAAALTPAPAKADWGGIQLDAGSRDTINSAIINYGGGFVNTSAGSSTVHAIEINPFDNAGAFVSITNNIFTFNADVPINLSPDALLATDPTRPLNSGAPFIHGNVFAANDYNGVGVTGGTTGFNTSNLDFNSVWAGGDFTYLLRDTIVLGPSFASLIDGIPPAPPSTRLVPTPKPNVTLTLQSTLPGTVLADGTIVAAPGVPLVIKLLNTPGLLPPAASDAATPGALRSSSYQEGAGFIVGVDNGIDPPADILIDPGAFSEIRIVGIGANQTTGQSRVPVIITSAHDNTVGTTVNGTVMTQLINSDTTAPKAGDGGVIYFGANSLTSYNLLDPRSGSIIDNADLKYLTRVEQQGNGIVYGVDYLTANAFTPSYNTLFGLPVIDSLGQTIYLDQYNAPKSLTVSNSNLSNFSDIAIYSHPGFGSIVVATNYGTLDSRVTGFDGEPTHLFLVNDTFSNNPTAIQVISNAGADVVPDKGPYPSPSMLIALNDTFYANGTAIHTIGQGPGLFAHVATLAIDSIFSNNTVAAVTFDGMNFGGTQNEGQNNVITILPSQLQYDDFFGNATNLNGTNANPSSISQAIFTDPGFRNPGAGNFFLLPTSSVIDRARSEIGPTIFGDMLFPSVTAVDPNNLTGPTIRNAPVFLNTSGNLLARDLDQNHPAGDINFRGGLGYNFSASGPPGVPYYVDIVTLPGRLFPGSTTGVAETSFPDEWIPVLQSSGQGTVGNAPSPAVYAYQPITGERDQVGNLRVKDPNSPNIGYGSRPFFDLGAYEYIIQNPPVIDAVAAETTTGITNIYGVGTIAGTNMLPRDIQVLFNERINPATLTGMSVILQASGGDGIFGNNNSPLDRSINLAGKLSFNPNSDILTIDTSGIFTSTALANDEFRLILKGTGSAVIRDNSGLALDGFNIDPTTGAQLPLPSGSDQFPGSDFQVTFTIDTNPPLLVAGTFRLDPASDTSGGMSITKINKPTFDGSITDVFPPINSLQGQTVHIDVSSKGDGVFDLIDAGIGTTDAAGNFKVTLITAIPDTPRKVGVDGHQEGPGSLLTLVRVRVVDQAGTQSDLTTDPLSAYAAKGALTGLQVDTVNPKVASFNPLANTVATVDANGHVVFTVVFTKNIKTSTLNANSILIQRSGGTGNFNTPIAVPLIASSFTFSYSTNPATLGYETVTFAVAAAGLPNDQYRVVLKGTGATPITDLATNPLDGAGSGVGSDYTSGTSVLFNASNSRLIYVGVAGSGVGVGVLGTRENPFPTIALGMKAALEGDDVLVLPGTYNENVTMKPGVRLLSVSPASTDTTFFAGSPYRTLIYGIASLTGTSTAGNNITSVYITGSIPGIPTEVSGFAILSPLIGDPNLGLIDPTDVAVRAFNTNAQIDRNIIVNAGTGVLLSTAGANAPTSTLFDNIIAGNINGVGISDSGSTSSIQAPFMVVNNTIADNTTGLYNTSLTFNTTQAYVINNIFFSNHDLTSKRAGAAITSYKPNTLAVGNNLFYQNGANNTPAASATGTFNGFSPALLSATPDALGNIYANPYFNQAEDPRPNADTPAVFFTYSNFDLTNKSSAINAADNALAPSSDFLYRTALAIAGHGFPGTGPASIGAFYYGGLTGPSGGSGTIYNGPINTTGSGTSANGAGAGSTGTTGGGMVSAFSLSSHSTVNSPVGGGIALGTRQFSVLTTSLSNNGTAHAADTAGTLAIEPGPSHIDVNFSDDIKASTLSPTDLVLSGGGLLASNPARATSLAWIDDHAVRFFLTGGYNTSGTVTVSLPQGSITDTDGAALVGFADAFKVGNQPIAPAPVAAVSTASPTATVAPTTLLSAALPITTSIVQPVAGAAPVAVLPPSGSHKLTPKQQKQQAAALKAEKAAEAQAHKAEAAAAAKAAKVHHAAVAKAAHKATRTK